MAKKDVLWECKPRTRAKLEIINHYLGAWFNILAVAGFKHVIYIDAFCGPGGYVGGEVGSPVIAAKHASAAAARFPDFKATLFFIDEDQNALAHLAEIEVIKKQHSHVTIRIMNGKFSDQLDVILNYLRDHPDSPTFSFVDPFGFGQSPFEKLKLLMHNDRSELFINFWCGFMNRFKDHPDDDVVQKIKGMVGSQDLERFKRVSDPIGELCNAFEANLRTIGRYTLKFAMRDEGNIRDNAFFFCSRQPKGFEKIKEAMWKLDPVHGNEFSAHAEKKNASTSQHDLFAENAAAQTSALASLLITHFRGRKDIPVSQIFKWVVEETPAFLVKHARIELENLLERRQISIFDPQNSGRKRGRNQWPERILVSFN